jgi:hypothetical protein
MDRQDLLDQIAELNHKINSEQAAQKAPEFGGADARFPTGTIIAAALVYAWGAFGGELAGIIPGAGPLHRDFGDYATYVAYAVGALAVIQILRMLAKGKPKPDTAYAESAERVRLLQNERRLLQEKLKSLGE